MRTDGPRTQRPYEFFFSFSRHPRNQYPVACERPWMFAQAVVTCSRSIFARRLETNRRVRSVSSSVGARDLVWVSRFLPSLLLRRYGWLAVPAEP